MKKKKQEKLEVSETAVVQEKRKKKKRKKAPVIVAIIVVLVIIVRIVSCAMMPEVGVIVTTTAAIRGDLQESIATSGTVVSEESKTYFAPVSGILEKVAVAAGDSVKKGDVLVSYNMEEMEKTLQQAQLQQTASNSSYKSLMADNSKSQAELAEANTNLAVLNQQIEDNKAYLKKLKDELSESQRETAQQLADDNYDLTQESAKLTEEMAGLSPDTPEWADKEKRLKEIEGQLSYNNYVQSTITTSDYSAEMQEEIDEVSERLAGYEEYKAKMESQQTSGEAAVLDGNKKNEYAANNEIANLTYEQAEAEYQKAKDGIIAEFDGIVTACTAVEGATVTDGIQLFTLESSNQVMVKFNASKYDVEKLEEGQKANIVISGKTYEGEVTKINRMAQTNESGTAMVGAEVHITNPDDKIILGLDAKLEILTQEAENVLLIPVEAVNADKEGDFLYVVENGVAVRKPIVCGISSDIYTEVKEGITEDDQIVLNAMSPLEEGMTVTAVPDTTGAELPVE